MEQHKATSEGKSKMDCGGSDELQAAKRRKVEEDTSMTSTNETSGEAATKGAGMTSTDKSSGEAATMGASMTSDDGNSGKAATEGASRNASDISTARRSGPLSRLPQELKDKIHEYAMSGQVGEDGVVEIMDTSSVVIRRRGALARSMTSSLWNYTDAFKPLQNQASFEAARRCQSLFLRRHRKFRATCKSTKEVGVAWGKYVDLGVLLASPRSQDLFRLVIREHDEDENTTLEALARFYIKAARQWSPAERKEGAMLLRRIDLTLFPPSPRDPFPIEVRRLIKADTATWAVGVRSPKVEILYAALWRIENIAADMDADHTFIARFFRMTNPRFENDT